MTNTGDLKGRPPGYGLVTNVINGGTLVSCDVYEDVTLFGVLRSFGCFSSLGVLKCGQPFQLPADQGIADAEASKIAHYKRYCDLLGVPYGANIDCRNQPAFG
jgi:hypothetical protein